jgi:hypothetical protein
MPDNVRPYEPLTSENAALVLVDHQVGLMSGVLRRQIRTHVPFNAKWQPNG